jgi:hypothetical protein
MKGSNNYRLVVAALHCARNKLGQVLFGIRSRKPPPMAIDHTYDHQIIMACAKHAILPGVVRLVETTIDVCHPVQVS